MQFQILTPYSRPSQNLAFSRLPFCLSTKREWNWAVTYMGGSLRRNLYNRQRKDGKPIVSAILEGNLDTHSRQKRKVVEHICLLKAKEDLSEEQEKDMLDFLYTTQYQMRGIVAISLGRISDHNLENYTHAIFMRFQTKEDLSRFYVNPFYVGLVKDHVMPYCHVCPAIGFSMWIMNLKWKTTSCRYFGKERQEFNYGVEFVLLIAFFKSSLGGPAEDAMTALETLTWGCPSLIVQATKGLNIHVNDGEYTHAAVVRFHSSDAFQIFINSSEYNHIWKSKFQPIAQKALSISFSVDPVGTELM